MFNSTVLEVGIGIVFCFSAVSLIVSSINEGIASIFKLRSKNLLTGVKEMLNDPNVNGLALALYNHAAINPLGTGDATEKRELKHQPSYIDASNFAQAMIDILKKERSCNGDLESAIKSIPDPQLQKLLTGMYERAGDDYAKFEAQLGKWFDIGMERVSGDYKRKIQLFTVLIAFAVAMVLNIDFFHLFKTLWTHPSIASGLSHDNFAAASNITDQISLLNTLPVGWTKSPLEYGTGDLVIKLGGWMVTALSALFGAPFWFDLLQKATNLRGSGPKADEKKAK